MRKCCIAYLGEFVKWPVSCNQHSVKSAPDQKSRQALWHIRVDVFDTSHCGLLVETA